MACVIAMQRTVHVPGLCGLQALYVVYDPYLLPFKTVIPANNEACLYFPSKFCVLCLQNKQMKWGGVEVWGTAFTYV